MWISSGMLLLLTLTTAPALAEDPATPPLALPAGVDTFEVERDTSGTPGNINLDVVNADIHNLLRLFGEVGELNFVVDESVQGTVTARLIDVHWRDALGAILLAKGLATVPVAGGAPVLRVEPIVTR